MKKVRFQMIFYVDCSGKRAAVPNKENGQGSRLKKFQVRNFFEMINFLFPHIIQISQENQKQLLKRKEGG